MTTDLIPSLETSVRQSDDLYRTFFEHSSEAIWRFELPQPMPISLSLEEQIEHCYRESVLAECNMAMAVMYGCSSPQDLVGARLDDLVPRADPHAQQFLSAFLSTGYRLIAVESTEQTWQGERIFLNSLVGIVEDGHLVRVWGTQSDITASKALEQRLRQVQRMEAIGRFAGGIAHDFNNLLAVILASSELLLESTALDAVSRDDAQQIRAAAMSGSALTRQLLTFARCQQLVTQSVDVNQVVTGSVRLVGRLLRDGMRIETVLEDGLPLIPADPVLLEQVILNLVVNARDAMEAGGVVTLTTSRAMFEEAPRSDDGDAFAGPYVVVEVRDTGRGISAELLPLIFEPFITSKDEGKGTGLGLATVYGIVRQSGGFVRVESTVGVGTTFRVYLPTEATAE